jgi:multisubunit Na+/H+ antiporter MnhB subunit
LGALFLVLSLALAGVAWAAANAALDEPGVAVIAVAAGALALWLATLAYRALRSR